MFKILFFYYIHMDRLAIRGIRNAPAAVAAADFPTVVLILLNQYHFCPVPLTLPIPKRYTEKQFLLCLQLNMRRI